MAFAIPTIVSYPNGVITVVSTDTTPYESILNSMGSYVYEVQSLYLKANSNEQILEGFTVEQYDVNGYIRSFNQKPAIDPYQYQTSLFFKLVKENIVLNGQTTFDINILPNEVIYLNIYTFPLSLKDYLGVDSTFDIDFFKNFNNVL
jgi:hypothetical protein